MLLELMLKGSSCYSSNNLQESKMPKDLSKQAAISNFVQEPFQ